ncbi:unnamed protein product [Penicillium salamii]|nr:unnamed protein product [Penicillium salamii]CAG7958450.1 unnamed protein product [Penicillium salamii]CAG8270013.1 unnamed protein product [Penicillium salamii]
MAAPSVSPLFIPKLGVEQNPQDVEWLIDTVHAPCKGLTSSLVESWLHTEQRNHLDLIQAAWSVSLRSYTGSNDVWFDSLDSTKIHRHVSPSNQVRSLFDAQTVELHKENSTAGLGANSAVFVSKETEEKCENARLDALREFDLTVYFSPGTETKCPEIGIHHKPSVISTDLATMVAETTAKIVEEIVFHTDSLIETLDICSDADINCLLRWNKGPGGDVLAPQCIHHIISQRCATQGDCIAVSAWDGDLTYAELDEMSSIVAVHLQNLGVRPDTFVPLVFEKSKWAIISLLGVLKAGAAYFFVNTSNPIEYTRRLCSSLCPVLGLCSTEQKALANYFAVNFIPIGDDFFGSQIPSTSEKVCTQSSSEMSPSNAMYITFTSGTTGMPKGIITDHSAFHSMAMANGRKLQISSETRMLQFASYSFDVSNRDMLITLIFGGCICVPSEMDRLNDLSGFMNRKSVNVASLTPSLASTLTPALCPSLQTLVLGGEPLTESHVSAWAKHVRLFNAYGVSESSGIAALASNIQPNGPAGNIGFGCGSTLWVAALDQPDKLAPIGALGELVIEGPSVARGYLGDEERTQKQFKWNPSWKKRIDEHSGESYSWNRIFHTGDLVRYNLDGSLQFLGRKDHQVKINGQRLELPAVEHHLSAYPHAVKAGFSHVAAVTAKNQVNGTIKLLAFLGLGTSRESNSIHEVLSGELKDRDSLKAELKQHLLRSLPKFMVPADLIFLQDMPLTTSGKINRLLLQQTAAHVLYGDKEERSDRSDATGSAMATTPGRRALVQSWAQNLGIKSASITEHDCFFQLGGDSIAAIKMSASLRQEGYIISVSDIFKSPTFSDMASVLIKDDGKFQSTTLAPFLLIQNSQTILDAILEELNTGIDQIEDVYPCTHMQQGLIALTAQSSDAYIGSYTWQLAETLDAEKFKDAWKVAWLHNPILRTRILQIPEGLFQVVTKTEIPWRVGTEIVGTEEVKELGGIDITHGPLLRFYLDKENFRLDIHHSLFDEWSLDLIMKQVERAYVGENLSLHPFSPFVQHLLSDSGPATEDFWRQEFSGLQAEHFPPNTSGPSDVGHPAEKIVLEHSLQLDTELPTKFTLTSIVRLAWAIVLWHHTGNQDVVFGATVSGRNANLDGIDQLSGPTLATLPVRVKVPTHRSVHDGLSQVQAQFVNMMVHEQTGLSRIRQTGKEAAEACNFQNLLVVQPFEERTTSRMFKQTSNSASSENSKAFASYPMVLVCRPEENAIHLKAAFDPTLLAPDAGKSLLRQMAHVIQQLTTSQSMCIENLNMVPPEDMNMLKKWNQVLPKAVDACIHDRIREMCITQPEALAVHFDNLDLTYSQLENCSNQFARHLINNGIRPGDFVPLLLERSPWVPVIMLAVLKTGAAFVLLDLSHPAQRLRTMCSKVDAKVVVSFKEHAKMIEDPRLSQVIFDPKAQLLNPNKETLASFTELPAGFTSPGAPAGVVFSSGSTGLPKGIILQHSALSSSAAAMREHGMLSPHSRVFHFASYAFDISIGEILFTLAAGACVCVPNEEDRRGNPAKAAGDLQVTWALLTPSVINLFDPSDVPTLEVLGSAGEPLTPQIVDMWAAKVQLFGMYAPAECTVISHIARIWPDTHHSNVGHSHAAVSWVADPSEHNRLVPIGTVGELIVEGPTVSSGYINDPEKTANVFISSPPWLTELRSNTGRLYKTGDLVRQTSDGSLLFVGRKDDQVKLHGQRLEVGEVEHCITSSCPEIRVAAVECIKIPGQNNRASLVAFICPQTDGEWGQYLNDESLELCGLQLVGQPTDLFYSTIQSLENSLRELLPAYMVPSFFIPIADLPLSLSGKVNRRLLREKSTGWPLQRLEAYQLKRSTLPEEDIPITARGRDVQEIVGQALHLDPVSISMNGNFFGLGGDSISAMQVSMLARRKGLRLSVADIFMQQTISGIASKCTADNEGTAKASKSVSFGQAIKSSDYRQLPSSLPKEIADNVVEAIPATEFQTMTLHNFYSRYLWISLPKEVNRELLLNACDQLVQKHSILRTVFYPNDDRSLMQFTLRNIDVHFVEYPDVKNLEKHCADDSIAMGVPINGEVGFQLQLLTLTDSRMFLAIRLPHALFDGISLDVICSDLTSVYDGDLAPACAQFSDHVQHVSEKRSPETYGVWREVLGGAPMTKLDSNSLRNWDRLRDNEMPKIGAETEEPQVVTAIAETLPISPPANITTATLVKLAWAITLSRLFASNKENDGSEQGLNDVVFGQVIHGRGLGIPHEDRIVGPCINIIPVRVNFPQQSDKHELLSQVQQQHIQTMPFENLELGEIARNCTSWDAGTKFGSFVRFQNFTGNNESTCCFDGFVSETGLYSLPNRPSNTANVLVVPHGLTLTITMTISNQVLDGNSADLVVGYFGDVIESLASNEAACEYLLGSI